MNNYAACYIYSGKGTDKNIETEIIIIKNKGLQSKNKKMLPKMLYEILPFLYLGLGVGSGVMVNSIIVFTASVLLMATGILVLTMRITYRCESRRLRHYV